MCHYQHFWSHFLKKKNSLSVWITLGYSVKRLSSWQNIYWTAGRDVRHRSHLCLKTSVFRAFRSYVLMCRRIAVEMLAQVGMRVSCMSGIFFFFCVGSTFKLFALLNWEDRKECFAKLEKRTDGADTSVHFFKLAVLICLPVDTKFLFCFAFCCEYWYKVDK